MRQLAADNVRKAQMKYKRAYDMIHNCNSAPFKIGEWIHVRFLSDESGSNRKLSRPWQGPIGQSLRYVLKHGPN